MNCARAASKCGFEIHREEREEEKRKTKTNSQLRVLDSSPFASFAVKHHEKDSAFGFGRVGQRVRYRVPAFGATVVAVDSYDNAPAMQVAHSREVINMLDGDALDSVVAKHKPDIIVPEIEAIRTAVAFTTTKRSGIQVVPSARAANFTMNRRAIRDLSSTRLGLRTAKFAYAKTREEFDNAAVAEIGIPCVVKPLDEFEWQRPKYD